MSRTAHEITLAGPLGSEGLFLERTGARAYRAVLAPSRGLPACPNALQFTVQGAAWTELEIEAVFPHREPGGKLDEYFHSATPDFETFVPLLWSEPANGRRNVLRIPATGWDEFFVGMQFPLPAEALERRIAGWARHPAVRVDTLGHSLQGRPIRRITVTAPEGSVPPARRWHHYVANQHPGEGNARWRIVGMIDWLLSADPAACALREAATVTLVPLLCPDGPANGWRRVNADGVDMNRCCRADGADETAQTREAWLFQRDLETLHVGPTPVDTLWCMHTWPGITEPIIDGLGPEFGCGLGDFTALAATFARETSPEHIKPLVNRERPGPAAGWNAGMHRRLGFTTALVEGGGDPPDLVAHRLAGAELMRAIGAFWHGPRRRSAAPEDLPRATITSSLVRRA